MRHKKRNLNKSIQISEKGFECINNILKYFRSKKLRAYTYFFLNCYYERKNSKTIDTTGESEFEKFIQKVIDKLIDSDSSYYNPDFVTPAIIVDIFSIAMSERHNFSIKLNNFNNLKIEDHTYFLEWGINKQQLNMEIKKIFESLRLRYLVREKSIYKQIKKIGLTDDEVKLISEPDPLSIEDAITSDVGISNNNTVLPRTPRVDLTNLQDKLISEINQVIGKALFSEKVVKTNISALENPVIDVDSLIDEQPTENVQAQKNHEDNLNIIDNSPTRIKRRTTPRWVEESGRKITNKNEAEKGGLKVISYQKYWAANTVVDVDTGKLYDKDTAKQNNIKAVPYHTYWQRNHKKIKSPKTAPIEVSENTTDKTPSRKIKRQTKNRKGQNVNFPTKKIKLFGKEIVVKVNPALTQSEIQNNENSMEVLDLNAAPSQNANSFFFDGTSPSQSTEFTIDLNSAPDQEFNA